MKKLVIAAGLAALFASPARAQDLPEIDAAGLLLAGYSVCNYPAESVTTNGLVELLLRANKKYAIDLGEARAAADAHRDQIMAMVNSPNMVRIFCERVTHGYR